MRIAIIGGSGKMGQWFAGFLSRDGKDVVITGRNESRLIDAARQIGVKADPILSSAVENADAILLAVPIDNFESVVKELKPLVKPGQMVIDVTSIKTRPVEIMQKYLQAGSFLGAHPVFGPGAKGLKNQNVVLTPTNAGESALAEKVKKYLEEHGALVSLMTPRGHDEMIAIILGLAHFIALAAADTLLNFKHLKEMSTIAGPTYKLLLTLAESVLTEDPELYASLQINLPGMAGIEEVFLNTSRAWADIVKNGDKQAFIERMKELKDKMKENDPDFGQSYKAMYRLLDDS